MYIFGKTCTTKSEKSEKNLRNEEETQITHKSNEMN